MDQRNIGDINLQLQLSLKILKSSLNIAGLVILSDV